VLRVLPVKVAHPALKVFKVLQVQVA